MSKKILLVDDSATIRIQVGTTLKAHKYEVLEAEDGQIALDVLRENVDQISLVLCDVNMPNIDGMQFLETAKGDDALREIPIVMLTTMGRSDMIKKAKELGAKGWIVKSSGNEKIIAAAKRFS